MPSKRGLRGSSAPLAYILIRWLFRFGALLSASAASLHAR